MPKAKTVYRYAVEVKPSQVRKLLPGYQCNVYVVAGEPGLFVFGHPRNVPYDQAETFAIVGGKPKNSYGKLKEEVTSFNVAAKDFEPRPKARDGWQLVGDVWEFEPWA